MSRMTEYIAIEDDNVISHFLQVWVNVMEDYWKKANISPVLKKR